MCCKLRRKDAIVLPKQSAAGLYAYPCLSSTCYRPNYRFVYFQYAHASVSAHPTQTIQISAKTYLQINSIQLNPLLKYVSDTINTINMQFLHQAEIIKKNFHQELRGASEGRNTSLQFIKHRLPSEKLVKNDEIFQVMVVGGTVFRKALVKKVNGEILMLEDHSEAHPALSSKEMFLEFVSDQIHPQSDIVSINFAFPLDPLIRDGRMDGTLIRDTKENTLAGLLHQPIGKLLEGYLLKTWGKEYKINTTNDAICLLLSKLKGHERGNIAGSVIGTGTNISFYYNDFAINLESGNFNKFAPTAECLEIDKASDHQDKGLFEKEIAGAYLYKQFNYYMRKNKINHPLINSTKELYDIAINNHDVEIKAIAESFFEKSAAYFAGQIAGLTAFKGHDMTFVTEGSVYWENQIYQAYFGEYLNNLSPDLKIKIVKIENSSIIGAARLIA